MYESGLANRKRITSKLKMAELWKQERSSVFPNTEERNIGAFNFGRMGCRPANVKHNFGGANLRGKLIQAKLVYGVKNSHSDLNVN